MSSAEKSIDNNISKIQQNLQNISLGTLCKSIAITGLILFVFYAFLFNPPYYQISNRFSTFKLHWPLSVSNNDTIAPNVTNTSATPTNISHVVIGIVGSMNTWKHKRSYVEAWWRPNVTRGYVFLERPPTAEFQPWPSSSPPFRVNENIVNFKVYPKLVKPFQVRIFRTILETVREGDEDVRWYVMADDDTVLFLDNLVEVLAKYDHTKYWYIGTNSECVRANVDFAFGMAFGGGGYALSYPLAKALAGMLDGCIERYPYLYSSDLMLYTCLADIGVSTTHERGFHQIDLHGDISGLLSSHSQSPLLSLHHIDTINPIFPSMNRSASINHLMKAAKIDHSRLLQQSVCYRRDKNWTFSISWGYSTYLYENIYSLSYLKRPLETFKPWLHYYKPPFYMFNTRWLNKNPCEMPHAYFLESIETDSESQVITTYVRGLSRNLAACSLSGNFSADSVEKVLVISPATVHKEIGKIECCDVEQTTDMNVSHVKIRPCMKDEIIA